MSVEYFDQLLGAACQVHVVYLSQLLGAVLFIHFISNHDKTMKGKVKLVCKNSEFINFKVMYLVSFNFDPLNYV